MNPVASVPVPPLGGLPSSYAPPLFRQPVQIHRELPVNFGRPNYTSPPTRWQESYNLYVIADQTNRQARISYENGWITLHSTKKIYLNSLHQTRLSCDSGYLALYFLEHLLDYGKFYSYILPHVH